MTTMTPRWMAWALVAFLAATPIAIAQTPVTSAPQAKPSAPAATPAATPAAPAAPAAPPSPVSGMRNKISAGDLLSAESILEVHRAKHGENGPYLVGLSWLARGALLLGDQDKAKAYAADVRARCAKKIAAGDTLEKDRELETALGAAIEVEAQLIERSKGPRPAAEYVRTELASIPAPVALRSRLNKRLNMFTMVGETAPELGVEDHLGTRAPTLASLRGKPALLFLWAEWCSDCKSQAASLVQARKRFAKDGLEVVAVTRYYEPETLRVREKARVDSVWKADYADMIDAPVVFSTASMERYGGSSTPTFVFLDRAGIVRRYTPTRLTEAELDRTLTALVK